MSKPDTQAEPAHTSEPAEPDLDAFIEKTQAELEAQDAEPEAEPAPEDPPAEPESEEKSPEQDDQEPAPEEDKSEDTEGLRAEQIARLARLETALKERENALKEREGKLTDYERAKQRAAQDPAGFLKSLGIEDQKTLESISMQLYATALGDEAPEELRSRAQEIQRQAELDALRGEVERIREEAQQATQRAPEVAAVSALDRELSQFVQQVPEDFKFLQVDARDNPQDAYNALCQVAAGVYKAEGRLPTANEAAKLIEDQLQQQLSRYGDLLGNPASQRETTEPRQAEREKPKTLSDADTRRRPDRRPPDPESMTDEDWLNLGIRTFKANLPKD